ncbi:hypothetical protein Tco_1204240 [Tanacetum coccineum]
MPSVVRSGAQDEGQAGSDPGTRDEGQARPNPDDVAESLPLPTPCVLVGPNLKHSDVKITNPSSQPQPEALVKGFRPRAYLLYRRNLMLTVDEQEGPCYAESRTCVTIPSSDLSQCQTNNWASALKSTNEPPQENTPYVAQTGYGDINGL